ncbi:hypothetical protein OHB93_02260 [Microbacterium sp. No. 7]|uniref:hypothetical protein n=1 Tax=Microbacterium sp. No. 7 TaxID=1714373 RepID=UPI00300899DD
MGYWGKRLPRRRAVAIIVSSVIGAVVGVATFCLIRGWAAEDTLILVGLLGAVLAGLGAVMSAASHNGGKDADLDKMDFHGKLVVCAAFPIAAGGLVAELSTSAQGIFIPALVLVVLALLIAFILLFFGSSRST